MTDTEKLRKLIEYLSEAKEIRQHFHNINVALSGVFEVIDADGEVSMKINAIDVHNEEGKFQVELDTYPNLNIPR